MQEFDFRTTGDLPGEDIEDFRQIQSVFAGQFAAELSGYLRHPYSIVLGGIRQTTWGQYTKMLTDPGSFVALRSRATGCSVVVELGTGLVFNLLEALLGSTYGVPEQSPRSLTLIERKLLTVVFRSIEKNLSNAWRANDPLLEFQALEDRPDRSDMAAEDPVVVTELLVRCNGLDSHLCVVVPATLVRQHRQNLDIKGLGASTLRVPDRRDDILALVGRGAVTVEAILACASIRVSDLASLEVGDVLNLGRGITESACMTVNGVPAHSALIAPTKGKRAFAIQAPQQVLCKGDTSER